jgi:hypothetical protein
MPTLSSDLSLPALDRALSGENGTPAISENAL